MKKLLCILFLLCSVITYSQTFYSPVIVKKTLRVDGRTALGGIEYTEDLTITADTILINGLDGTGNILIIDVDGNVLRGTGTGTGGISGLVPTEILFGKSDGTIDQSPNFIYVTGANALQFPSGGSVSIINGAVSGEYAEDHLTFLDASKSSELYTDRLGLYIGANGTKIYRQSGGSTYNINLPNANGINGQALRLNAGLNLEWFTPPTGTVTSIATTSPIGGGTITTTGTLNLLGSAADRILYTTGVNTWAETVSTSFGRSLMDDANAAAGLATLGIPVDANRILFGDGTGLTNTIDFTYDISTNILDVGKFHVDGDDGWITYYEGATLTDGQLLIGRTSDGVLKLGTITSSDLTVGYSDPNITLDYAAGSIASGDLAGSIDATKIADGSVTSTEFQYINTLSSNAQTQLDSKVTSLFASDIALTAQSAAIAFNTIYTTPAADGWYRVNCNLVITTAATTSSTIGFRVRYTSAADAVVKTTPNINDATRTAANTTGTTVQYSFPIYVDASTNIQYETLYASSGATAAVYAIYVTLEKIH